MGAPPSRGSAFAPQPTFGLDAAEVCFAPIYVIPVCNRLSPNNCFRFRRHSRRGRPCRWVARVAIALDEHAAPVLLVSQERGSVRDCGARPTVINLLFRGEA